MSDTQEYTITSEDGTKIINVTLEGCSIKEGSLHIHTCGCCGTCDCNGNGNGNGDGNGDGDGDGTGIDDDKPGNILLTLVGSTGNDCFHAVLPTEDGYLAFGESEGTPTLVEFTKELKFVRQNRYVLVQGKNDISRDLIRSRDGSDYVLSYSYDVGLGGLHPTRIDAATREILDAKCVIACTARIYGLPEEYTGAGAYMACSHNGNTPHLITMDEYMNPLLGFSYSGHNLAVQGLLPQKDGAIILAQANGMFSGANGGFLIRVDTALDIQTKLAVGYERNMSFKHMLETKDGYYVIGEITDSGDRNSILLLGMDKDFTIVQRAIVGGAGDEYVHNAAMDADGRILLCGYTNTAGAGGWDYFLMRLEPDFTLTKQLTFGTASSEDQICDALFNADGSVTLVGGTPGAGMGNLDAFIATFKGNWKELTGPVAKYPPIRVNGLPGFKVKSTDFDLMVNTNPDCERAVYAPGIDVNPLNMDAGQTLSIDPNAII